MAKIYDIPGNIKVPEIKFDNFNLKEYQNDIERFYKEVKEALMADGYNEEHLGEVISFPVADGKAEYMVFSLEPIVQLVYLPIGDAWEFEYAHLLTKTEVLRKIQQQKALSKLFNKN
jgi:hypothetical protein